MEEVEGDAERSRPQDPGPSGSGLQAQAPASLFTAVGKSIHLQARALQAPIHTHCPSGQPPDLMEHIDIHGAQPPVSEDLPHPKQQSDITDREAISWFCGFCCLYSLLITLFSFMMLIGAKYSSDPQCSDLSNGFVLMGALSLVFLHLMLGSVCFKQLICCSVIEGVVLFSYHIIYSVKLTQKGIDYSSNACPRELFYFFRVYQIFFWTMFSLIGCCSCLVLVGYLDERNDQKLTRAKEQLQQMQSISPASDLEASSQSE